MIQKSQQTKADASSRAKSSAAISTGLASTEAIESKPEVPTAENDSSKTITYVNKDMIDLSSESDSDEENTEEISTIKIGAKLEALPSSPAAVDTAKGQAGVDSSSKSSAEVDHLPIESAAPVVSITEMSNRLFAPFLDATPSVRGPTSGATKAKAPSRRRRDLVARPNYRGTQDVRGQQDFKGTQDVRGQQDFKGTQNNRSWKNTTPETPTNQQPRDSRLFVHSPSSSTNMTSTPDVPAVEAPTASTSEKAKEDVDAKTAAASEEAKKKIEADRKKWASLLDRAPRLSSSMWA